eukprot:TRINITY_DN3745_c0_g3_i1.p1 TRINITY_DN3745_c0_g3~~TRINITY_DN3745_c0_g3_i1.p1  ORF type:complete len:581 (-),score=8.70 TRINITY_DN3745_c0_g3_i1:360-1994(-)
MLFTEPYLSLPFYIFSRDDDPHYSSLDSLVGSRVAAPRGYMIVEWLRRNYPGMHVVPSYSIYDGLEMVYRNEVSAFINDYPSTTYVLENSFLPDMGVNAPVSQLSHVQLHMGVRDDMPLLRDIINKINSNLPEKDVEEIRAKWFSKSRLSMLNFSKKERDWIDRHKELTFATDPAWLPFEGYDEQTMQFFGISNDILHLISKRTGLSFKLVDTGSWDEIKEIAKEGRVDMLPTVTPTDELAEYLEFSKPYIKVPFVLFGDKDSQDLSSMEDLESGSKIAVIENSYIHDRLEAKYKNIEFVLLQNKSELLESVLDGESDFFIDNLASGTYALNSSGDKNIVGLLELSYEYAPSLGFAKDMDSVGLVVINKAIDSITDGEIQRVQDKWVFAEKLKTYDSFAKWSRQYWFVFVGVLVLGGVLFLRYRMKRSAQLKAGRGYSQPCLTNQLATSFSATSASIIFFISFFGVTSIFFAPTSGILEKSRLFRLQVLKPFSGPKAYRLPSGLQYRRSFTIYTPLSRSWRVIHKVTSVSETGGTTDEFSTDSA